MTYVYLCCQRILIICILLIRYFHQRTTNIETAHTSQNSTSPFFQCSTRFSLSIQSLLLHENAYRSRLREFIMKALYQWIVSSEFPSETASTHERILSHGIFSQQYGSKHFTELHTKISRGRHKFTIYLNYAQSNARKLQLIKRKVDMAACKTFIVLSSHIIRHCS